MMFLRKTACPALLVALLVVACGGCGSNSMGTVPVTGIVTLDGDPVEGAKVSFQPELGRPAGGTTNAAGEFTLTTMDPQDGALPGKHTVTVSKTEIVDSRPADLPEGFTGSMGGPPQITWIIPQKYSDSRESGLTVEVSSDMELPVELKLTK